MLKILFILKIQFFSSFRRLQGPSSIMPNRTVLQPTPVLPIYSPRRSITLFTEQQHLPLIKERMIKANLAQKACFKCKSPLPYRPDSSLSRSTTAVITASQLQIKTYNPLKVTFQFINLIVFFHQKFFFNSIWMSVYYLVMQHEID
jgi:hypothetical protein